MRDWPTTKELLVDCNVFEHMWSRDAKFNPDGHVTILLALLAVNHTRLCVDHQNVIRHEYRNRVEPLLKKEWQVGNELEVLRYWMLPENQEKVDITRCKELIKQIKTVIIENERADRTYVCVAFSRGRPLISNDQTHIVIGPDREKTLGQRRDRLLRATKRHRAAGAEILFSAEAHHRLGET
jgi:hypothetical protein